MAQDEQNVQSWSLITVFSSSTGQVDFLRPETCRYDLFQRESEPLVLFVDAGRGLSTPRTLPCLVAYSLSDWLLRSHELGSVGQTLPLHFEFHRSHPP